MTSSINEISDKNVDYIVIGGGTAGLTVAARLSEDSNVTVAVLEAGSANLDDPVINIPAQFGIHFGDPKYSWEFSTLPQKTANDMVYTWPRGKTLGGSSAINFFMWTKPPAVDIDAWEKLGNPGWNAARYFEYSRKVEKFHPPSDEAIAKVNYQIFKADAHGYDGSLDVSFPTASAVELPFQKALANVGIEVAKDPLNGDPFGATMVPNTHHPITHTRTSATTAFYSPNKDRKNLKVLSDALVTRIIMTDDESNTEAEAAGVEFEYEGKEYFVRVDREVIVSAGALQSPQILELSGIGDKRILEPLGIKTVVDLPGVGANMQEHSFVSLVLELEPGLKHESLDILFTEPDYSKKQLAIHGEGKSLYHLGLSSCAFEPLSAIIGADSARAMIQRQREKIQAQIASGLISKSFEEQYKLQLERLENNQSGDCEFILIPSAMVPRLIQKGRSCVSVSSALNLPFSRGTIHIKSTDPREHPIIDPHTFEDTFDLDVLTTTFNFSRKLSNTEPFKSAITKEVFPGRDVRSESDIHNYLKENLVTTYHTAGTASMLPRELDGVVDPKLRVYGTKNIRVVDLSIVPLHVASHTQATAYTIGEIAADIIKGKI